MAHVVLGYRKEPNASVFRTFMGAPDGFHELPWDEVRPWPRKPALAVENPPGAAKRAGKLLALDSRMGAWLLRRSVVEPVLGGVDGVALRPVSLCDKKHK